MIPLLVIRHGPTEWNEEGRIQGRADPALSETGRNLLSRARLPPGWDGALALSSPLQRAIETARLLGLDTQHEPALTEMDWGAWEGRRLRDLRGELGADMALNELRGLDFRPPGGESPRDVQRRLRPLLAHLSGPTICVTHKGVLRALYSLATGWDMTGKPPDKLLDGHVHTFALGPTGRPVVQTLNIPLGTQA
jgi:probable phosphoglycerate mutase